MEFLMIPLICWVMIHSFVLLRRSYNLKDIVPNYLDPEQRRSMTEIIILNMAYWRQASAETESVEKNCYYIQKTMEANNKLRVLMGDHVSDEEIVLPADHFSDFADDEDLPEGVIDLATQRELRGQKNPPDSLW